MAVLGLGETRFVATARRQRWSRPRHARLRLHQQQVPSADSVWARLAGKPPPPEPAFLLSVHGPERRPSFRYAGINEAYRDHLARVGVTDRGSSAEARPISYRRSSPPKRCDATSRWRSGCEPLRYEVGFEFSDRSENFEVTLEPILDGGARCTHVLGVARDLSQLAEDAALRESERRFVALVEHSSDMVTVLDGEGTILYGSPSVTTVLGWPSGVFTTGDPSTPASLGVRSRPPRGS